MIRSLHRRAYEAGTKWAERSDAGRGESYQNGWLAGFKADQASRRPLKVVEFMHEPYFSTRTSLEDE